MKSDYVKNLTQANLDKFRSIDTFREKIDFWEDTIGLGYIYFLENYNDLQSETSLAINNGNKDIQPIWHFEIQPAESEWLDMNNWILENYLSLSTNPDKNRIHFTLDSLITSFNQRFSDKDASNRLFDLNVELEHIDKSFIYVDGSRFFAGSGSGYIDVHFNSDHSVYDRYRKYGFLPNYALYSPSLNILRIANAITLSHYRDFIEAEIEKCKNPAKEKTKKEVSIGQQMQILYYLDILNHTSLEPLTGLKKAKLFSVLLKSEGTENIRRRLSGKDKGDSIDKQKENIQFAIDLFEEIGLEKPLKSAQKDLERLSKK